MNDKPNIVGDFTTGDVAELVALAKRRWWAKRLWGPVICIAPDDDGARITTGKVYGPLGGHGWYHFARKIDGEWKIVGSLFGSLSSNEPLPEISPNPPNGSLLTALRRLSGSGHT